MAQQSAVCCAAAGGSLWNAPVRLGHHLALARARKVLLWGSHKAQWRLHALNTSACTEPLQPQPTCCRPHGSTTHPARGPCRHVPQNSLQGPLCSCGPAHAAAADGSSVAACSRRQLRPMQQPAALLTQQRVSNTSRRHAVDSQLAIQHDNGRGDKYALRHHQRRSSCEVAGLRSPCAPVWPGRLLQNLAASSGGGSRAALK